LGIKHLIIRCPAKKLKPSFPQINLERKKIIGKSKVSLPRTNRLPRKMEAFQLALKEIGAIKTRSLMLK